MSVYHWTTWMAVVLDLYQTDTVAACSSSVLVWLGSGDDGREGNVEDERFRDRAKKRCLCFSAQTARCSR